MSILPQFIIKNVINRKYDYKDWIMRIVKKTMKEPQPLKSEGAEGVALVNMVGEEEGAPNFVMRLFKIEPNGHTPFHHHDNEHVVYVIKGSGVVRTPDGDHLFESGDGVFVAPNEEHQFRNTGEGDLLFTCTIPLQKKNDSGIGSQSCCGR